MFPKLERDVGFPLVGCALLFLALVGGGLLYQALFSGGAAERLVTVMLIDAIIVLGIQVYVGNTGVLSFGHIGFGAIAGYTFAVLAITPEEKAKRIPDAPFGLADVDMGVPLAILIAVIVACIAAVILGIGLARSGAQSGAVSATVITLALLFVTHEVARNWPELTGGERVGLFFPIGGKLDSRTPIYAALLGSLIVARLYAQSRSGRLAVAAREDNLAARAMGVNPLVQQMVALVISVAIVAVGASLSVYEDGSLLPENFFFNFTLLTLVMLIVGGRNSVTGAVVGVAVMTIGRELARRLGQDGFEVFGIGLDSAPLDWVFRENLQTVFLGLSMLGFMIWRPKGLIDDWELDEWLRAVASVAATPTSATRGRFPRSSRTRRPPRRSLHAEAIDVIFGGFQRARRRRASKRRAGEVVGIIGPNGAGKTTLVNVITSTGPGHQRAWFEIERCRPHRRPSPSRSLGRGRRSHVPEPSPLLVRSRFGRTSRCRLLVAESAPRRSGHCPTVDEFIVELRVSGITAIDAPASSTTATRVASSSPARPRMVPDVPPARRTDQSGMSDSESLESWSNRSGTDGRRLVGAGVSWSSTTTSTSSPASASASTALDRGAVIAHGTPAEVQADPTGPGRVPRLGGGGLSPMPVATARRSPEAEIAYCMQTGEGR